MAKIVLVGANHGGIAAANVILKQYSGHQLTIFDRNSNMSYLGCGTALWIGRQIKGTEGLFYSSFQALLERGAIVHNQTEVENIDFTQRKVTARTDQGQSIVSTYDKLILATGSLPITPHIPGIDLDNVHYVKLFQDGEAVNKALDNPRVKNVAIVGAGYIGVEIAEAVQRRGRKALLFETAGTSLSTYYDPDFTSIMDKNLADHGVELHFNESLKAIEGSGRVEQVVTDKGKYPVQLVLLAIGFRPDNALGKDHLQLFHNGAYLVDRQQRTSDPYVYAIGDCATVWSNALEATTYIALATNAVRSGIVAGHNVCDTPLQSTGVQGSNGICIYNYKMVSTGLSLTQAQHAGFDALATDCTDLQKPAFIEENNAAVKLRLVYERKTRRLLGAQMASTLDMSMGIHMFSLAIQHKTSVDELALLDIFFLPHFNQPYNYITLAALKAKK